MSLVRRYLTSEIFGATAFVFAALLSLFALLDLIRELKDFGVGNYRLGQIISYVLLSVPGHVYEVFPIAVLIGTIFALAHLADNSEYTVIRFSGVSSVRSTVKERKSRSRRIRLGGTARLICSKASRLRRCSESSSLTLSPRWSRCKLMESLRGEITVG